MQISQAVHRHGIYRVCGTIQCFACAILHQPMTRIGLQGLAFKHQLIAQDCIIKSRPDRTRNFHCGLQSVVVTFRRASKCYKAYGVLPRIRELENGINSLRYRHAVHPPQVTCGVHSGIRGAHRSARLYGVLVYRKLGYGLIRAGWQAGFGFKQGCTYIFDNELHAHSLPLAEPVQTSIR